MNATIFVFYHEVTHALIDVLRLPTTGREEDAADDFATVITTEILADDAPALAAALSLYLQATKGQSSSYWDEHSLNEQRFFRIVCLLYGSNPNEYASLAEKLGCVLKLQP